MPVARYYTVTQVREVQLRATTAAEAAVAADKLFNNKTGAVPDLRGVMVEKSIEETSLNIQEIRHGR